MHTIMIMLMILVGVHFLKSAISLEYMLESIAENDVEDDDGEEDLLD